MGRLFVEDCGLSIFNWQRCENTRLITRSHILSKNNIQEQSRGQDVAQIMVSSLRDLDTAAILDNWRIPACLRGVVFAAQNTERSS